MIRIMMVTMMLKSSTMREYLLACLIFISPKKTPVRAEAAYEVPRGTMKMNVTMFTITTSAAKASTLIKPENMASNSKTHHSKHNMHAPGIAIFM